MRAVTIVDGELRWVDHRDPRPSDTELLVAVRAAGVNAADLLQRRGLYPAAPGVPADIPGLELAGEVVEVGAKVRRFAVGDRVMAVVGGGAQAELAVVDEATAMAVPGSLDWPAAGGFPEAFSTAYDALFTQCSLGPGDRVLVTGAAGGVGTAAVQLARAAGARVVASVRNADHHRALAGLGATEALAPGQALAAGPFDVAVELVGASSLPDVVAALAPGGRVSVIGVGSGARVQLDLLALMQRRARVSGSTLRSRSPVDKAVVAATVEAHAVPLLAGGQLQVPLAAVVPMTDPAAAYDRFAAGGKLGKLVMVTGS